MSRDGAYGWRSGQKSVEAAVEDALANCSKNTSKTCRTVMIDDEEAE